LRKLRSKHKELVSVSPKVERLYPYTWFASADVGKMAYCSNGWTAKRAVVRLKRQIENDLGVAVVLYDV
jgi:hypothetical protein